MMKCGSASTRALHTPRRLASLWLAFAAEPLSEEGKRKGEPNRRRYRCGGNKRGGGLYRASPRAERRRPSPHPPTAATRRRVRSFCSSPTAGGPDKAPLAAGSAPPRQAPVRVWPSRSKLWAGPKRTKERPNALPTTAPVLEEILGTPPATACPTGLWASGRAPRRRGRRPAPRRSPLPGPGPHHARRRARARPRPAQGRCPPSGP